jgi:hypothetical protein
LVDPASVTVEQVALHAVPVWQFASASSADWQLLEAASAHLSMQLVSVQLHFAKQVSKAPAHALFSVETTDAQLVSSHCPQAVCVGVGFMQVAPASPTGPESAGGLLLPASKLQAVPQVVDWQSL